VKVTVGVFVSGEKEIDSCAENNGGCHHDCRHSSSGPVCTCHHGFRLLTDQKSCEGATTPSDYCQTYQAFWLVDEKSSMTSA